MHSRLSPGATCELSGTAATPAWQLSTAAAAAVSWHHACAAFQRVHDPLPRRGWAYQVLRRAGEVAKAPSAPGLQAASVPTHSVATADRDAAATRCI
jgi:hypothetical protein